MMEDSSVPLPTVPTGTLSSRVEQYLGAKEYSSLVEEIFAVENLPSIHSVGMDLITKICEQGLLFADYNDAISACTKCLMHVVHNYRPKEALICLLEQGEAFVNNDKFTYLLPALQFVMLNLPKKREKTFSWVLSTLKSHIKYFHQISDELKASFCDQDQDDGDKNSNADATSTSTAILQEQDEVIQSILQTYKDYIDFYRPFVQQLSCNAEIALTSGDPEAIESIGRQKEYLRDYLVDLLGVPLIHLNLDWTETDTENQDQSPAQAQENSNGTTTTSSNSRIGPKIKTDARIIAEELMSMLLVVDSNPSYFFPWLENRINVVNEPEVRPPPYPGTNMSVDDEDEDEEEIVVHMSSIVGYFYLIFIQGLPTQQMSFVYSPTYMLNTILYPVTTVLKNASNPLAILKAIKLTSKFLSFCDTSPSGSPGEISYGHRLHHNLLQKEVHGLFIDRLAYLVVYCPIKKIRGESYALLKEYLVAFDPQGKHDFLYHIFHVIPSDALVGQMIMELKQLISVALDPKHPNYEKGMEDFFLGKSASRLILTISHLRDGATTDLCQNSNKVICTLNLLRFLLLRDRVENRTGILNIFSKVEEVMLNPLRAGINLSKSHYELKLKELNDPHLRKEMESEETRMFQNLSCDVKIGGDIVKQGDISHKEQKSAVVNALNTFDHMTGLMAWVYEAQGQAQASQSQAQVSKS